MKDNRTLLALSAMHTLFFTLFSALSFIIFFSCSEDNKQKNMTKINNTSLEEGRWKGVFHTDKNEIPFIFDIKKENDTINAYLINGKERILLKNVQYFSDSVLIPIASYDAQLVAKINSSKQIEGYYQKLYLENDKGIYFTAQKTEESRFTKVSNNNTNIIDINGKWDLFINENNENNGKVRYIGIFNSERNEILGSIATPTGDLGYSEGIIDGNKFYLSSFNGLFLYLVEGSIIDKDNISGKIIFAKEIIEFTGKKNDSAQIDAYSMTTLKEGSSSLNFKLPNTEGKEISINDENYKGKVVIVSILGSWCPNCLDEMAYLAKWYDLNKERGVEIIGVSFERKNDFEYAKKMLNQLKEKYKPNYEILFGGSTKETSLVFPQIEKVRAYPTTIFIDKKGIIKKIHTGFNGPATGELYERFKYEFNKEIDELLNE